MATEGDSNGEYTEGASVGLVGHGAGMVDGWAVTKL